MANKLTESIFSCDKLTIPLADVQHIERRSAAGQPFLFVITKHTKYNTTIDDWENPIFIPKDTIEAFMNSWCMYRHEFDEVNLANEETKMDMDTFFTNLVDDMEFDVVKSWAEILAVDLTEPDYYDETFEDGVRVEVADAMGKVGN